MRPAILLLGSLGFQAMLFGQVPNLPEDVQKTLPVIEPHVIHDQADGHIARRVFMLPHFATTVRMRDAVQNIVLGDTKLFRAEHDEGDPSLVIVHAITAEAAQTNLEITTVSGQQVILWLVSEQHPKASVDFALHFDTPGSSEGGSFWRPESNSPSVLIAQTIAVDRNAAANDTGVPSVTPVSSPTSFSDADPNARLDELLKRQQQAPLPKLYGQHLGPLKDDKHLMAGVSEVIDAGKGNLEPHDGSLSGEEVTAELEASEEHEAAPETEEIRGDKLREAIFAENANPEPEVKIEEEPVSWWEKVKHSALYGNKHKAEAAKSSNRNKRRQNKTGMLAASVVGVLVAGVWLFTVISAPVRKQPDREAQTIQQPETATQKSLTPGLEAHPNEQQPSPDGSVTAADIRATSNGTQSASSTTKKPADAPDEDYALGKIPPPPPAPASAPPPPTPPAPEKNPLDTTALVFVRHAAKDSAGTEGTKLESVSYQPALALKSQEFDSLVTGTRLVARLETPVSTVVSLPAVATVEYNYEDKDHTLLIPAGSRVFGTLEQADAQGFVGLHFTSIQRLSDPAPIPFEARAIGLDYKPLKGVVTGRNRGRRFLVRAGTGLGQIAAATVGTTQGTGATDALNSNVLIREQVMNNIGSAADQEIQQMAYSEHRVVTLSGNTRFYLVIDHQAKTRERRETREQQAADSNASNASVQAQLLELRKELADITAKQTPLAVPTSDTSSTNPPQ